MSYHLSSLFMVMLGSALGGVARYWVSGMVHRRLGGVFPWGTLAVNVSGALLVGVIAGLATRGGPLVGDADAQLLLIIGLCGSYTTVSSFSLQTLELLRHGRWPEAGGNIAGSLLGCLMAVWLGWTAALVLLEGA